MGFFMKLSYVYIVYFDYVHLTLPSVVPSPQIPVSS